MIAQIFGWLRFWTDGARPAAPGVVQTRGSYAPVLPAAGSYRPNRDSPGSYVSTIDTEGSI